MEFQNRFLKMSWKESVISVLADIDVLVESQDIVACHRFGEYDRDRFQKTIVCFVNWKTARKFSITIKKINCIDNSKHNFMQNTTIFANENLTPMNESIAYNCRRLKHISLIHGCFSRDGIVRIKRQEKDRPVKIFHMDKFHMLFPDFDLGDADEWQGRHISWCLANSEWLGAAKLLVCGLFWR